MQRNLDSAKLAAITMHIIPLLSCFKPAEMTESYVFIGFFLSIAIIFALRIFQVASYKQLRFPHHKETDTFEKE